MASTLNEHSLEKKLISVNNTQDSIQTLSLWILHHKVHHLKIVEIWFKVLKKVKVQQRLTLFYVANDVIQHSKRKGLSMFLDSFSEILKEATLEVRDESIKNSVARIFTIWDERNIYQSDFIRDLQTNIGKTPPTNNRESENVKSHQTTANEKLLAEFKPQKVFDTLLSFRNFENEVELKRRQLSTLRLDASSTEALKHLKDRAHGNKFSKEFGEATAKLDDYVKCQDKEIADRKNLLELLDQAQLFYSHQYGEAKIVANAYKNFGTRINNLKKKLDELKKTLPDPTSPIPSPSMDAPSPDNTPPDDSLRDNTEEVDMELSDDDDDDDEPVGKIVAAEPLKPPLISIMKPVSQIAASIPNSTPSLDVSFTVDNQADKKSSPKIEAYSPSSLESAPSPEGSPIGLNLSPASSPSSESDESQIPVIGNETIASTLQKDFSSSASSSPPPSAPLKTTDEGVSSLDSRLSSILQNISSMPLGLQNSFLGDVSPPPAQNSHFVTSKPIFDNTSQSSNTGFVQLSSTTTSEGGGGTPLKDEGNTTPLQDEENEQPAPSENPIEFLTRIISKSHGGQSGLEFLENLSSLTNKVKMNLENEKNRQHDDSKSDETTDNYPAISNPPVSETKNTYSSTHIPGLDSSPTNYTDSWSHGSSQHSPAVTSQFSASLWSSPLNSVSSQMTTTSQGNSLSLLSNTTNSGPLITSANAVLSSLNSELNVGPSATTTTSLNSLISSLTTSQSTSSSLSTILSVINSNHSSLPSTLLNQTPALKPCPAPVPPPNLMPPLLSQQTTMVRPAVLPKPILKSTSPRPPFLPRLPPPVDMDYRLTLPSNQISNVHPHPSAVNCDISLDSNADQTLNSQWSSFDSNAITKTSDILSYEVREPQPPTYQPPALPLRTVSGQEVTNNQNEFLQKLKEKTSQNFSANFPQVTSFKNIQETNVLPPPPPPPPPAPIVKLQSVLSNLKTLVPYNSNSDQDSDKSSGDEESLSVPIIKKSVSDSEERQLNLQENVEEKHDTSGTNNCEMTVHKIETTLEQRMRRGQQFYQRRQNEFDPNSRDRWSASDRSWENSRHSEVPYNKQNRYDKNYDQSRNYDFYERNNYSRRDQYSRDPQSRQTYYPRNDSHSRSPVKRPYPYTPHY